MASEESLKIRVSGRTRDAWVAFCERKQVPQTTALEAILRFVMEQDDLTQSMILRQVAPANDLVEVVLRRMARRKR